MSQERDYISINISKWTGLPSCKNDAEIERALSSMVVAFGITDYFFDTDDYTSPLKMNFRNDINFYPASGLKKLINVKIRSNIVADQPSPYPFSDPQSYEFYSINEITNDIVSSQNNKILVA